MRKREFFRVGIEELLRLTQNSPVALMCAEEDPSRCYRRLLIGPALEELGVRLLHIRADGTVQASAELGSKKAYRSQLQVMLAFEEVDE